ncbi:MAG: universal stress protein [Acidimicrobiales bacterium]
MGRIVVGVDGSEHSVAALRWAVEEAKLRNAQVEAVISWQYPVYAADPIGATAISSLDPELVRDGARRALEEAIAAADAGPAPVTPVVLEGSAGHALIETARGAELLVVGSRGHGGFAGLLLGSVSTQCVHHAPCPVVVVRPAKLD